MASQPLTQLSIFRLFLCFASITSVSLINVDAVEIAIKQGKLFGTVLQSRNGTRIHAFLSIPYAKPPIGKLRFQPPQEPDTWTGVRNATMESPMCVQMHFMTDDPSNRHILYGQEDCLYLNIYSSVASSDVSLPVMVFIHGGAFVVGAASIYKPHYLLDNQIVLVTINYRLGPLGFLSAADKVLPGNYGMKDQVAALKWIQQNIAAFGGNPKEVTIFGESAGAASVHLHLYSPLSRGLFHRAIVQSGTGFSTWAQIPPEAAREKAHAFAILSGCPTTSTKAMVDCLRDIPAGELYRTHHKFYIFDFNPSIPFPTVVEPKDVKDAFLVKNPWNQKVINDVPLIIGCTSGEGGFMALRFITTIGADGKLIEQVNKYYKRLMPLIFNYHYWLSDDTISQITESLRKFYFNDNDISENTMKALVDISSDGFFVYSTMEGGLSHTGKIYFYYYDHRNKNSLNQLFGHADENIGTAHGDDLISFFPSLIHHFPDVTEGPDLNVSHRMINYWVNFAKTGCLIDSKKGKRKMSSLSDAAIKNPNGEKELWFPMQSNEFEYLHITTKQDKMKTNLLKARYSFWKSLQIYASSSAKYLRTPRDEL